MKNENIMSKIKMYAVTDTLEVACWDIELRVLTGITDNCWALKYGPADKFQMIIWKRRQISNHI